MPAMNAGQRWTKSDKTTLLSNLGVVSLKNIAAALGRTELAILSMARKLEIN